MWRNVTARYFHGYLVFRLCDPGTGAFTSLDVTWSLLCLTRELGQMPSKSVLVLEGWEHQVALVLDLAVPYVPCLHLEPQLCQRAERRT